MGEHMQAVIPDDLAHENEVREMLAYYRKQCADETGEIIRPFYYADEPSQFVKTCRNLGVTWPLH